MTLYNYVGLIVYGVSLLSCNPEASLYGTIHKCEYTYPSSQATYISITSSRHRHHEP
jgi:hypothetical protein